MEARNKERFVKNIFNGIGIYLFLSFAACIMVIFRKIYFGGAGYSFLIWNLFLAWVPLILAASIGLIYRLHKRSILKNLYILILGIGWFAFYPNCAYLITDYIHISGIKYYYSQIGYVMNFDIWYDFVLVSLFVLTGFLLGFISLYLLQIIISDKFNKALGWMFVIIVLVLSSFGVYLGRFVRWNSWDLVFNLKVLLKSVLLDSKHYAAEFTVLLSLFLILIYFAIYYIANLNKLSYMLYKRNKKF